MSKYTVHFTTTASLSITVDADDPDDAIGKADDKICSPGALVYASHPRGFDMGGDWELDCVTDSAGAEVWGERAGGAV